MCLAGNLAQRVLAARHDQAVLHRLAPRVGSWVRATPPALPLPWHPCVAATLLLALTQTPILLAGNLAQRVLAA